MNNIIKYLLTLSIVGIAIYSIFYLIFPTITAQMIWCTLSTILFLSVLFKNILIFKNSRSLTIDKLSINLILYVTSGIFMVWTLLFVFLSDEWSNQDRSLSVLYIGYLIILVISIICFFAAEIGNTISIGENEIVQSNIQTKYLLVNKIDKIILRLRSQNLIDDREINNRLGKLKSLLQTIPTSTLNNSSTFSKIENELNDLELSIATEEISDINIYLQNTINNIKNIL